MDKKVLQDVKEANKKVSEGSLALWNARLDALANVGRDKDLIDYLMRKEGFVFGDQPTNDNCNCPPTNANCPCEEGGRKITNVVCPPQCPEPPDPEPDDTELRGLINERLNEMSGRINLISKDINEIKNRFK